MKAEYIYQRKGLSEYLGGVPERTIQNWEKAGILKAYKMGRQIFYKKEEIDKAIENGNLES